MDAGNVVAAVLAGVFGYIFGIGAVFGVMAAMASASLVATWFIDPKKIDHRAARGLSGKEGEAASGWSTLASSKPLLVLAATPLSSFGSAFGASAMGYVLQHGGLIGSMWLAVGALGLTALLTMPFLYRTRGRHAAGDAPSHSLTG